MALPRTTLPTLPGMEMPVGQAVILSGARVPNRYTPRREALVGGALCGFWGHGPPSPCVADADGMQLLLPVRGLLLVLCGVWEHPRPWQTLLQHIVALFVAMADAFAAHMCICWPTVGVQTIIIRHTASGDKCLPQAVASTHLHWHACMESVQVVLHLLQTMCLGDATSVAREVEGCRCLRWLQCPAVPMRATACAP
jgi:hypothetical protein